MDPLHLAVLLYDYMLRLYSLYLQYVDDDEKPNRRFWVHPINSIRDTMGVYQHLGLQMRLYPDKHHEYYRMTPQSFDHILLLIKHDITKQDTVMRKAITHDLKLALTLHHLASGCDFGVIHKHWRVGKSTAAVIVIDVCKALWKNLAPIYLQQPRTDEEWQSVAQGFEDHWNFPNCLGAIDGKHITIQKPWGAGSEYFNYKKCHSLNLMAISDSRYRFLMVDIGQYGSESDGGVWENSKFNNQLETGKMKLPDMSDHNGHQLKYVFVADEAFPLKENIMRPYPGKDAKGKLDKTVYNYRLSRARRVIENAFGILAQKWQVLKKPIIAKPENVEIMVAATTVLHNYLRIRYDQTYLPAGSVDSINGGTEGPVGAWRTDNTAQLSQGPATSARNYTVGASNVREKYKNYFMTEGAVAWQIDYVTRTATRL